MSRRVLLVDDESHIVHVLSMKLRNAGMEVVTASDGEEGFETAIAEQPDLIVSDFHMPFMTGVELCHALAGRPETAKIPVILLTARGYTLSDEELASGNIKDILSKPFSPRAVVELVEKILQPDVESEAA